MDSTNYFHSNEAINHPDSDFYNFNPYAVKVQDAIKNSTLTDEPMIFGLYGKWGEGKSSFLNLVFKGLESNNETGIGIIKFKFNPWRYNSEEKLLFEFFNGLIKVINHNYSNTSENSLISKLKFYTNTVLSGSTIAIEKGLNLGYKSTVRTTYAFKDSQDYVDNKKSKESLESQKAQIDEELKKFGFRIVVFIDDIDRLTKEEVNNVFRLVKLTASFKNLTFVLAFDDEMVAKAIYANYGDTIEDGYKYLEKIVNIPLSLPKLDKSIILKELKKGLEKIFYIHKISLEDSISVNLSHNYNSGVYRFLDEIKSIENYIQTPRMMIRVLNSFSTNLIALKGEVNYSDLLWLELLKLKHLKVYNYIKHNPQLFVIPGTFQLYVNQEDNYKKSLLKFIENEGFSLNRQTEILAIVYNLFPVNENGLSSLISEMDNVIKIKKDNDLSLIERRITHFESFERFFNYHTVGGVSNSVLDNFIQKIKDSDESKIKSDLIAIINEDNRDKVKYELEKRITQLPAQDKYKLINVMISSLDVIIGKDDAVNIFQRTQREELIQSLFNNVSELGSKLVDNILNDISEELSISDILYARRGFTNDDFQGSEMQIKIDKKIIDKVKSDSFNIPFFSNQKGHITRSIMSIWNELDSNELNTYVEKHLSKNNLIEFVMSFPTLWSSSEEDKLDDLTKKNYDFLKSIISPKLVYEKTIEFYPDMSSVIDYDDKNLMEKYSNKNNIKYLIQFVYWYNSDKENPAL